MKGTTAEAKGPGANKPADNGKTHRTGALFIVDARARQLCHMGLQGVGERRRLAKAWS
jgi:hypothetical protein